jgi:hypothetical protein
VCRQIRGLTRQVAVSAATFGATQRVGGVLEPVFFARGDIGVDMTARERFQLGAIGVLLVAWVATLVEAWPLLVAHLKLRNWISAVGLHVGVLVVAFQSYQRSRTPSALTRTDVLAAFSVWALTCMFYSSLILKLVR